MTTSSMTGKTLGSRINMNRAENGYIIVIYLISILLIFGSRFISDSFGTWQQFSSILVLSTLMVVIGFGQGIVILLGELDLSIPAVISLAGVLTTAWMGTGTAEWWAIPAIAIVLALVGLINGIGVTLLKIPSFIMTLATQMIIIGSVLGFTNGTALGESPAFLTKLMTEKLAGIPLPLYLLVLIVIVGTLIQKYSKLGRSFYSVGSNRRAAYIAGLPVNRLIIGAYIISAVCAGLTGMMLVGYAGGATLTMGDPYLLPSIAAVVIGGTSITGGKGNYLGTVGATVLLTTVSTVIQALGISEGWQTFIYGLMILAVLGLLKKDLSALLRKKRS